MSSRVSAARRVSAGPAPLWSLPCQPRRRGPYAVPADWYRYPAVPAIQTALHGRVPRHRHTALSAGGRGRPCADAVSGRSAATRRLPALRRARATTQTSRRNDSTAVLVQLAADRNGVHNVNQLELVTTSLCTLVTRSSQEEGPDGFRWFAQRFADAASSPMIHYHQGLRPPSR